MNQPLVIAYGLGVDSTAALVELYRQGIRPDLILFANTGDEKDSTYAYLPIIQGWLTKVGFPPVTIVRYVPQDYKHWPPYYTLAENCLTNGTLPSLAFGFKSCSLKWKVQPQNKYCSTWPPAINWWEQGGKVKKVIGYDASPNDRKRFAHSVGMEDPLYDYWYPLIDWNWDRDRCKAEIAKEGLPVPPKSACFHCPASQPEELHELKKGYLRRIVIIEARAKPRLEGHIPQEELDRQHLVNLAAWEKKNEAAVKNGKPVSKKPRHAQNSTGVLGLWRRGRKGTRGGKKMPGMMTDYIREHKLLPEKEIDYLISISPAEIISNQAKFADGFQIPEWHDFLEAFTPEDALEEIVKPSRLSLPLVAD